jgi:hypothetical protein
MLPGFCIMSHAYVAVLFQAAPPAPAGVPWQGTVGWCCGTLGRPLKAMGQFGAAACSWPHCPAVAQGRSRVGVVMLSRVLPSSQLGCMYWLLPQWERMKAGLEAPVRVQLLGSRTPAAR